MRLAHIYQTLLLQPWFITQEAHAGLLAVVDSKMARSFNEFSLDIEDFVPERREYEIDRNNIAHIPIQGPIAKGVSKIERSCGVADVDLIRGQIEMSEKRGVSGYMFHVNSPGGTVTGVPELSSRIANLNAPSIGYTDTMIASAAYYMVAGTNKIIASPMSSNVGSIGVYIPWVDYSERAAQMGLKFDPIIGSKGDLKAIGATPSLSKEHRAFLQERVDKLEEQFRTFVTDHRPVSDEGMRGQVLFGKDLLDTGLVDYLASYEDAYDTLIGLI
jgi:signal peptide peptidase SppA